MRFTDIFIKKPILAVVVNLLILLVGLQAVRNLPVQQYPSMESTSITITTRFYGASAEDVRGFVTTPIERSVSAVDGVDYVESASTAGLSTITVRLRLNVESKGALAEVGARLDAVRNQLPPEAEAPSLEITRADRPFASFYLSAVSESMDRMQLTEFLSRQIEPELISVRGVQRAQILGGRAPAMRIWLDPARLAQLGLSPGDVNTALIRNNFISTVGRTQGEAIQVELMTDTDLKSAKEFGDIIVRERDGATVRLRDVAKVELGSEEAFDETAFTGQPAIFVGVWSNPGVNEI
jgi:multidrug efflux pump